MKKRLSAYFSYLTLWDEFSPQRILRKSGGQITGDDLEWPVRAKGRLQLATLWFDDVILQLPRDDPGFIISLVERDAGLTGDTVGELERTWVPVKEYDAEYKFLGEDLWTSGVPGLVEEAERVTVQETKKKYGVTEEDVGFAHEAALAGAGLIDSVNLWFRLMARTPCCFIPNDREQQVLEALFSASTERETFEIFSEVIRSRLPDLSAVSWNTIIELKHSAFLGRFRQKMFELHRLIREGSSVGLKELVDEMVQSDLKALARSLRPSVTNALVRGVASNLPLPIPMNPLSVIESAAAVHREHEIQKKYGWLYFLLEVEPAG